MTIIHQLIELETEAGIQLYDITTSIQEFLTSTPVKNGQVLVFSRHTTTALTINENEPRLFDDIKAYLKNLAPEGALLVGGRTYSYRHNDLHLRPNIPADEPMNAHSHLMAITLSTSEIVPVVDGKLALGTYQSILLFELDGPRKRTVFVQVSGEEGRGNG
jgi:secondary thiamine-phosphate synthase enzyme